ncbi:MAG: ROK family protein [Solidesulfovibrio sp.]|uniref:ROK family protein n=1 Tax=Solidesulfovibrio sp. TaxID=2910990 RepID=UPI002B1FA097|nr:ROK family protein [Solidesulfovibrio sp.]MEA4855008.1 ROK family protein [Solidesulfovibrio sp.]
MKSKLMLGAVEAGGTKFVCTVGDIADCKPIIYKQTTITTSDDPGKTLKLVIDWFQLQQKIKSKKLLGIGIASFGPLCLNTDSEHYGSIMSTPKKNWSNFNILNEFNKNFPDTKIYIDTDVNGSALGEFYFGAAKGLCNFIYITIGTGIGAGGMVNGKLIHGLTHPEMGHIKIKRIEGDTFTGNCQYHGDCWEGLCSGPAFYARANIGAEYLPITTNAWDLEIQYTAAAVTNIIYCFSPEKIIIGGGISKGGTTGSEEFLKRIREKVLSTVNNYIVTKELTQENIGNYIVTPALGNNSGSYGALMLANTAFSLDTLTAEDSRKRIEKEDDLINHRMSWCVGSNSFLLAALMVASNNSKPNIFSGMVKGFIPYAGLTLSISFTISILAAYFATWNWRRHCEIHRNRFTFSPTPIALPGSIASILSPTIFISIWIVLIRTQHYIFQSESCPAFTNEVQAVPYILSGIAISFSIVLFALSLWILLFFTKNCNFIPEKRSETERHHLLIITNILYY